mmetsp:Transcript_6448/g.10187  ORF Transcript_6448/g.10187 Transcript_6448/m.10187 type:complete len:231 (+) Transcript_6448:1829-2521(+)
MLHLGTSTRVPGRLPRSHSCLLDRWHPADLIYGMLGPLSALYFEDVHARDRVWLSFISVSQLVESTRFGRDLETQKAKIEEQLQEEVLRSELDRLFCAFRNGQGDGTHNIISAGPGCADKVYNHSKEVRVVMTWLAVTALQKKLHFWVPEDVEDPSFVRNLEELILTCRKLEVTGAHLFAAVTEISRQHLREGEVLTRLSEMLRSRIQEGQYHRPDESVPNNHRARPSRS